MNSENSAALQTELPLTGTVHLRLLATSDLHVHILPFDYYTGETTNRLGLARTASLIDAARSEAANSLLFDNGDFLQGSPLGDFIASSSGPNGGANHAMINAMNLLQYDAGTLGNHEFNFGLDFLTTALKGANFPFVTANLRRVKNGAPARPFVPPYAILNRIVVDTLGNFLPIKIGVIGFTPPQVVMWDHRHLAGKLVSDGIVDAAKSYVPMMRRDGADIIIALSHSGIETSDDAASLENASTALARIDGIDAVIAGHSHLVFPSNDFAASKDIDPVLGTLCGKPAVMPGFNGSHLGVIDLVLTQNRGSFSVKSHTSEARPICQRTLGGPGAALVATHAGLAKLTDPVHRAALEWVNRPIGKTDLPLHSYFALLTNTPALEVVAAAQIAHVQSELALTDFAHLPVLASVAPFKAGGRGGPENYTDVPAGDVMLRNIADLYIHPNTSVAIQLTGAEIAIWLEYAAGIFNQILPGSQDAPLINPDFPSFNFDMIFGIGFQIDVSKAARFDERGTVVNPGSQRISGLTFQGAPLDPAQKFAVATNSYRVSSNGGYLPQVKDNVIYQSAKSNLDVLLQYVSSGQIDGRIAALPRRFAAIAGTSVTFDTSPKALDHVADLDNLSLEPLGPTASGFLRFRLHL